MMTWIRTGAPPATLACSLMWLAACGSSSSNNGSNAGTDAGTSADAGTDGGTGGTGITVKVATLNAAQETPANASTAFGGGVLAVDESTGQVGGFVVTSGLVSATAAHVHIAARNVAGAIIVPMTGGPDVWVVPDGATPLTAEQIAAFESGGLYFNVHTAANPGGEIRGQIDKVGTARLANLTGGQETPPTASTAFGDGIFVVNGATGIPGGFLFTTGLTAIAAHAHQGARGVAGGIVVPMTGGPNLWVVPDDATALTAAQTAAFNAGDFYYNAHTAANPGGEIRGQLDRGGDIRVAALDAAQEVPPTGSSAFGAGILAVDGSSGQPSGFQLLTGLTAIAAHAHQGARGANGAIVVPMTGGPTFWVVPDAATPLTADQRTAFVAGGFYYNAHTAANPGGEIRGQLDR